MKSNDRSSQEETNYRNMYSLLHRMCNHAPDMIWAKDLECRYLFANQAICDGLLKAKDAYEPIGKTDLFFALRERAARPEDPQWHTFGEICCNSDMVVLESSQPGRFEEFGNVRGKFVCLDVRKAPFFDDAGRLIGTVGCARDITREKETEQALRESEEKYRQLFEMESDALFLIDAQSGAILDANAAAVGLYGYSREELLQMRNVDLSAEPEETKKAGDTAAASGVVVIPIRYHRKKDGTVFPVEINATSLLWKGRQVFIPAIRDITERMVADVILAESEEKLREVLENSLDAAYKRNLKTNGYDYLSPVFGLISGYTPDEMKNLPIENAIALMHPDDLPIVERLLSESLNGKTNKAFNLEYRFKHKDGQYRWFHDKFIVVRNSHSEALALIGSVSDITERRQMEKEVKILSTRLNLATQAGGIGVWEYDFVTKILFWDDQMFTLYGVDKKDFTGADDFWQAYVHPGDLTRTASEFQRALSGEIEFDIEFRVCRSDGSIRNIRSKAVIGRDDSGQPLHVTGTNEDITKFKQAEEELLSSKLRYQTLMNQSSEALVLVDIEAREAVEVNRRFTEMFGYSLPEDAPLHVSKYVADSQDVIFNRYNITLPQQRALATEAQFIRHKNGSLLQVERAGTVIHLCGKDYLLASSRDMTKERKRQAELERDAEFAHRVQKELLPDLPESPFVTTRILYYPSNFVSGDSYFLEWCNEGTMLRGFLLDVIGHGLATALQTSSISVLLRETAALKLSLLEQMYWINKRAAKYFLEDSYAAMFSFELDLAARELRYVSAGITQFYSNGNKVLAPGMFVGLWNSADFDEFALPISAGDNFCFLTDGFTDVLDRPENADICSLKGMDFDAYVEALKRLAEKGTLRDDATGICVKIKELL